MKYLSYRILRNGFNFIKTTSKNGKVRKYKSAKQQLEHSLRIEKMDIGYLTNPKNQNLTSTKKGLVIDNKISDEYLENSFKLCQEDYKKHNNKTLDKRTKPFLTHLLSFSSGFYLDFKQSKEMLQVIKEFLNDEFGSFISIALHRDETSFHIEILSNNYDFRTHKTIGRNLDTSKLQDKIQNHLEKHNVSYGHKRGIDKKLSMEKHMEVKELKEQTLKNLDIEIDKKIKESEEISNNLKDIKDEYNEMVSKYYDLKSTMKNIINGIKQIKQNKQTIKKLESIEKLINSYYEDINIDDLNNILNKLLKREKTLNRMNKSISKQMKLS